MILVALYLWLSDSPSFLAAFPVLLVSLAVSLLLGMTIHEYGHAIVAYRLGDSTAKRMGRLSPNPLRHMHPVGTAMLIALGIGWAKPVLVNYTNLRTRRPGVALVAAAGPLFNLATVAVFSIPIRAGLVSSESSLLNHASFSGGLEPFIAEIFVFVILFNLVLAVFNLIPIVPLDGSNIVTSCLSPRMSTRFTRIEKYGAVPLMVLLALDYLAGTEVVRRSIIFLVNWKQVFLVDPSRGICGLNWNTTCWIRPWHTNAALPPM